MSSILGDAVAVSDLGVVVWDEKERPNWMHDKKQLPGGDKCMGIHWASSYH